MRLQHVASQQVRRFQRRYPFLRRVSITTTLLTLIWLYAIYWGERSAYSSHIEACAWNKWEQWPRETYPHHLVFIADPQLVDPHTYPGRRWPLSTMTERYTDLYMARNFRLINERLDPDSIIFLGDLFDGGREWAPDVPKGLKKSQRKKLQDLGIMPPEGEKRTQGNKDDGELLVVGWNQKRYVDTDEFLLDKDNQKRSMDTYAAALSRPHSHLITKSDHNIGPNGEDLKAFTPGENGRWSKWGNWQWLADLERFSKIFFTPQQLYPVASRQMLAAYDVNKDPVSVENGAKEADWQEYATTGGKQRRVISSLPGNHDLGFGPGVQLAIRDRFQTHFGDGNRIDIIGNHTFVGLDVLSLAAHSYFKADGYETDTEQQEYLHIWRPGVDFLENLKTTAPKKVGEALGEYYPNVYPPRGWQHEVVDPGFQHEQRSTDAVRPSGPKPELPIIVLTHVPLFRMPDTNCGNLRERDSSIRVAMGYQYQNVLTQGLSKDIVTKVSDAGDIVGVFSGDDHDYCDVTHRYNIIADNDNVVKTKLKHIREITVKSFSWAMGVRKPGFLLVSLWNPVDAQGNTIGTPLPTVQTHLCLLPDQLGIFINYGLFFGATLVLLIFRAIVLSLHGSDSTSDVSESNPLSPIGLSLPRFQPKANSQPPSPTKSSTKSKSRPRGTSTSNSSHSRNGSSYLGVQRSYNARTRSVSPAFGSSSSNGSSNHSGAHGGASATQAGGGPLIEKAGYFPQVKWMDPADDESDEESHLGNTTGQDDDSQAKWKWRRREKTPNKARKALEELVVSLLIIGVPCGLWYAFLVKNG